MNIEVTSVAKKEQKLAESAAAIYVLTQEDLRRSGVTSIPEALRGVPGLEVGRVDSHNWAITSRGFNDTFANKLLVMMDGRSVYTPLFSGVFWDVQDTLLEDIDRIEVVRGPGASLWGANAVNGVINIITMSARETQGGLVSGGGGTEERGFGSVRYGGKLGSNAYYRVYGKYFARDESKLRAGTNANDAWEMGRGGFRVDWDASDRNLVTVQGDIYGGDLDQTITQFSSAAPYFPFTAPYRLPVGGGNVLGRWTHQFAEESNLRVQAYYDRTRRDYAILNEDRDTIDLDIQHRFPAGDRQDIVWGTGYRATSDAIEGSFTLSLDPDHRTTQLFSGFVQDEIALVEEKLALTLGLKFEHNDFTGFEIQPSGRLAWTPHERHTFWAAVARAVRTPSRGEADGLLKFQPFIPPGVLPPGLPSLSSIVLSTPDLAAEELIAYELGYRVQPHERVTLDVATFFNVYDRLRSAEIGDPGFELLPPPPHFTFILGNQLSGETYGAELAANWQLTDWWRWGAAYTYLNMQIHTDPGSSDFNQERILQEGSPVHQFSFRSRMDLPHQVEFDAGVRYVDAVPRVSAPSYLVMDVRLGWRPVRNLELSVAGHNLFERRHREYNPDLIQIQRTQVEQSVYAKATWRF